jgi:hypothetical protein
VIQETANNGTQSGYISIQHLSKDINKLSTIINISLLNEYHDMIIQKHFDSFRDTTTENG